MFFLIVLLKKCILNSSLKNKNKQFKELDIQHLKSIKVCGETNWYVKYFLPHLTLSFVSNYK